LRKKQGIKLFTVRKRKKGCKDKSKLAGGGEGEWVRKNKGTMWTKEGRGGSH